MSKYISPKAFVVILILSVVVTYGMAFADFAFNITKGKIGIPFGFSSVSLMGSSTDYTIFLLDIVFWFVVIWGGWKVLQKFTSKR